MRDYTNLTVWRKSHDLTLRTYRLTAALPTPETYGLRTQMRRAASSIPSNIAEGAGRRTAADYRRFINVAAGSASELEYQLMLIADLGYVPSSDAGELRELTREVRKMLHSFSARLAAEG